MAFWPWNRSSLSGMLSGLAACGVHLRDGETTDTLLRPATRYDRGATYETLERGGYEAVLIALGDERLSDANEILDPPSDDVWHFDVEAINDHGDYAAIVRRLCRLTCGDLDCEPVTDHVDIEAGIAWIALTHSGRTPRLDLKVNDDWTDEAVFSFLQDLLAGTGSHRRFVTASLGQDMLVVYLPPAALDRLNRLTRLRFQPLT